MLNSNKHRIQIISIHLRLLMHIAPSTPLVDAVALLCFGCLGLTSIDKFTGRKFKDEPKEDTPNA